MADNSKRRWGGTWVEIERLSSGGQGAVYKVANIKLLFSEEDNAIKIKAALREFETERMMAQLTIDKVQPLIDAIRQIADPVDAQLGALKELLPADQAIDPETAKARMKIELETLRAISHPALVKVLDDDVASGWFVMEYFKNGSLARHLDRFKGDVLGALRAIKPIVEAVSELHKKSRVHRDVKPDNVFIADDGHLVLGDCGLVFSPDEQSRLTRTRQNVGTRDYQPPWTYSQRIDDVKPTFDVFGLVKLLWAMVAGEPAFPLEDFDQPPHDLRAKFPGNSDVEFLHQVFKKCIVRRENQCSIPDAGALLNELDVIITAIQAGAVVPSMTGTMRCRFCGVGVYKKANEFAVVGNKQWNFERRYYVCDNCGHLEFFVHTDNKVPPAWRGND